MCVSIFGLVLVEKRSNSSPQKFFLLTIWWLRAKRLSPLFAEYFCGFLRKSFQGKQLRVSLASKTPSDWLFDRVISCLANSSLAAMIADEKDTAIVYVLKNLIA